MLNLLIDVQRQLLLCRDGDRERARYRVSTAANGPGQLLDSQCTPLGIHRVYARIGAGAPVNTVFVGRQPTGELYSPQLRQRYPDRDWILTRILWLTGLEDGINRLGEVDTRKRFIYIHGAPDDAVMGVPGSHGCIRMTNDDIIELFDQVQVGTPVRIVADCSA